MAEDDKMRWLTEDPKAAILWMESIGAWVGNGCGLEFPGGGYVESYVSEAGAFVATFARLARVARQG